MKKIFALVFICFCFILTGCSYAGAGLIQNSDGSVVEFYYVPFPEKELLENFVSKQKINSILLEVKKDLDTELFANLINDYQKAVEINENYTLQQKKDLVAGVTFTSNLPTSNNLSAGLLTNIRYQINFGSADAYTLFKTANKEIKEEKIIEVKNNFFTKTQVVKKAPLINVMFENSLTIGGYFTNMVNQVMSKHLGVLWNNLKQELNYEEYSSKFNYTYVVPTKRIHSNANSIVRDKDGYYYHTWEVNLTEGQNTDVQIEYWTTTANKWVWYVISLIGAGIIGVTVYFIASKKEKKEEQSFKINYDI